MNEEPEGMPRWAKVFAIVLLVLVLAVVIMLVVGPGGHGPGRHMLSNGAVAHASP